MTGPDQKSLLRNEARQRRRALLPMERESAQQAIARHFLSRFSAEGVVAGYASMDGEVDVFQLVAACARTALPCVESAGEVLVFRQWRPGDALLPGPHGTRQPEPAAPRLVPDVVLVPLLAYDARGHRLGFGAGYYDRTLEDLRARGRIVAVGIAFSVQAFDDIPVQAHDQKLDAVVTEKGLVEFK